MCMSLVQSDMIFSWQLNNSKHVQGWFKIDKGKDCNVGHPLITLCSNSVSGFSFVFFSFSESKCDIYLRKSGKKLFQII